MCIHFHTKNIGAERFAKSVKLYVVNIFLCDCHSSMNVIKTISVTITKWKTKQTNLVEKIVYGRPLLIYDNEVRSDDHVFHRWFVGGISRLDAENRLRPLECGAFLIRDSESTPGEFSVSVRSDTTLKMKPIHKRPQSLALHVLC